MSSTTTFSVRKTTTNTKVILFIHGFNGEAYNTFGMLPAFLAGEASLNDWDIFCFGYPTSLSPDITGIWSSDPDLSVLARYLSSKLIDGTFDQYTNVALIAHSMGGLITRRALLDGKFDKKVSHLLLFGTPNNGLHKASRLQIFKRQVRDMGYGSPFVSRLNNDWAVKFNVPPSSYPFTFLAVAGIKDQFVPPDSSVGIFEDERIRYVKGNHLEMVKPLTSDDDTSILIIKTLSGQKTNATTGLTAAVTQPRQAAIINELLNKPDKTEKEIVKLALALELTGKQNEAVSLLLQHHAGSSEITGVLAGRWKRQWMSAGDDNEIGIKAYESYKNAYQIATSKKDHAQAYYNGINVAFMELALNHSRYDARENATKALEHCKLAGRDHWRLATEGEAHLYLGDYDFALDCYKAALREHPDTREIDSMYQQAMWISRLIENEEVERKLTDIFTFR